MNTVCVRLDVEREKQTLAHPLAWRGFVYQHFSLQGFYFQEWHHLFVLTSKNMLAGFLFSLPTLSYFLLCNCAETIISKAESRCDVLNVAHIKPFRKQNLNFTAITFPFIIKWSNKFSAFIDFILHPRISFLTQYINVGHQEYFPLQFLLTAATYSGNIFNLEKVSLVIMWKNVGDYARTQQAHCSSTQISSPACAETPPPHYPRYRHVHCWISGFFHS